MRPITLHLPFTTMLVIACSITVSAAQDKEILLANVQTTGGKPLMEALRDRKTTREFKVSELPRETLGNLLWAAFGINRPATGHRTAPSAMNSQEMDILVALKDGLYVYEASSNKLKLRRAGDFRPKISSAPYCVRASAVLLYVAGKDRMTKAKPDTKSFYAAFDAGCICQNVYLFCSSKGLGTVVFDLNRPPLAKALELNDEQEIIMAQAVGIPE